MDMIGLVIQLASGAVGGNLAGSVLKQMSLGTLGNSLAGAVGGGLGAQILSAAMGLAPLAAGSLDIGAIVSQIAGGGVGGGLLMIVVGLLRKSFAR
jgi:hypothetical protein